MVRAIWITCPRGLASGGRTAQLSAGRDWPLLWRAHFYPGQEFGFGRSLLPGGADRQGRIENDYEIITMMWVEQHPRAGFATVSTSGREPEISIPALLPCAPSYRQTCATREPRVWARTRIRQASR